MKSILTLTLLAASALGAHSAIIMTGDSSTFDYLYEMDVNPATQNQDARGGIDWFAGTSGGVTRPEVVGGVAVSNHAVTPNEVLFRGDFNTGGAGSVWRELVQDGAASDWTLEIRVTKVTATTQGSAGWFGIATANLNESNSSALTILDDRIRLTNGSDYMIGTDFTTGYQTIRIAHDTADNAYYYWINGTLLNSDLSTAIAGTNGNAFDNNTFIGDYSGTIAGDWQIDYIRIDESAIAAVPEPSSMALLGLGGLALLRRQRK